MITIQQSTVYKTPNDTSHKYSAEESFNLSDQATYSEGDESKNCGLEKTSTKQDLSSFKKKEITNTVKTPEVKKTEPKIEPVKKTEPKTEPKIELNPVKKIEPVRNIKTPPSQNVKTDSSPEEDNSWIRTIVLGIIGLASATVIVESYTDDEESVQQSNTEYLDTEEEFENPNSQDFFNNSQPILSR